MIMRISLSTVYFLQMWLYLDCSLRSTAEIRLSPFVLRANEWDWYRS